MIDLKILERDLLEMKADTLYKYGKKVELADEMLVRKLALKRRLENILEKIRNKQVIKKGWFRKKRQQELLERVESKLKRADKTVEKLKDLKDKYIDEFKMQREACGLLDHSFLDSYYSENSKNKVNDE